MFLQLINLKLLYIIIIIIIIIQNINLFSLHISILSTEPCKKIEIKYRKVKILSK